LPPAVQQVSIVRADPAAGVPISVGKGSIEGTETVPIEVQGVVVQTVLRPAGGAAEIEPELIDALAEIHGRALGE